VPFCLSKMNEKKLSSDCLQKIDNVYEKFENELDLTKPALQLQLDRAYAMIFASQEARAIVASIFDQEDIPDEILNYIESKNAGLLKIIQ